MSPGRAPGRGALLCAALLLAGGGVRASDGLRYELPAAGSYELPPIDRVSEHTLIDADGRRAPILDLAPGQLALVAFVYLSCSQADGCPLSLSSLYRVDRALHEREDLRGRVRLVTVSFDPARDRPEKMSELRSHLAPKSDWRFFTAGDAADLAPVLDDYGQHVTVLVDENGKPVGDLRHVTKVFLVDSQRRVRNIYSAGFLDSRIVVRDVETLLLESGKSR